MMKTIRLLALFLIALLLCAGLCGCGAAERAVRSVPAHPEGGEEGRSAPLATLHAEKALPAETAANEGGSSAGERETQAARTDASNGESAAAEQPPRTAPASTAPEPDAAGEPEEEATYILNMNTKRFHLPSCSSVKEIRKSNREERSCTAAALIRQGYKPCKRCIPAAGTAEPGKDKTGPARSSPTEPKNGAESPVTYVVNTNTRKFHLPSCSSAGEIKQSNRMEYTGSREELIAEGYEPCKRCNP